MSGGGYVSDRFKAILWDNPVECATHSFQGIGDETCPYCEIDRLRGIITRTYVLTNYRDPDMDEIRKVLGKIYR